MKTQRKSTFHKIITILLSTFLLAEHALIHQAEAHVWEERKKNRPPTVQIAQGVKTIPWIPSTLNKEMEMIDPISSFHSGYSSHQPFFPGESLFSQLSHFGSIRNPLPHTNENKVRVILIQDIHGQNEAQINISRAIQELITKENLDLIGLEGSFYPYDFSSLKNTFERDSIETVADYLLTNKEISGPIHAALACSQKNIAILGVDNPNEYQENIDSFLKSREKAEWTEYEIEKKIKLLNELKNQSLPRFLITFDQFRMNYLEGQKDLADYLSFLTAHFPTLMGSQTKKFLRAAQMEKSINFDQVEKERSHLLQNLLPRLIPSDLKNFKGFFTRTLTVEKNPFSFYHQLKQLLQKYNLSLSGYPLFETYLDYVETTDQIDLGKIIKETKSMEKHLINSSGANEHQKNLLHKSYLLALAKKLIRFGLSYSEWNEYKEIRKNVTVDLGPDIDLLTFEKFYDAAERRNLSMAQGLIRAIEKNHSRTIAIVAGGFHSVGIEKFFREKNLEVIQFVPRMTKLDQTSSDYLSVFAQQKNPLDLLFEGEKLFLASPPFPETAQMTLIAGLTGVKEIENGSQTSLPPRDIAKIQNLLPHGRKIRSSDKSSNQSTVTFADYFKHEQATACVYFDHQKDLVIDWKIHTSLWDLFLKWITKILQYFSLLPNAAFGTICEIDHRFRINNLNKQIQEAFDHVKNARNDNSSLEVSEEEADKINNSTSDLSRSLGQRRKWIQEFLEKLENKYPIPHIFFLNPSSESIFWWVDNRYAAAHFSKSKNSIYISLPLALTLTRTQLQALAYHEVLHLQGRSHNKAAKAHKKIDRTLDNLIEFLAAEEQFSSKQEKRWVNPQPKVPSKKAYRRKIKEIKNAQKNIRMLVKKPTPLIPLDELKKLQGLHNKRPIDVFVKMEGEGGSGSFKDRPIINGIVNSIQQLADHNKSVFGGFIRATTGNNGVALAWVIDRINSIIWGINGKFLGINHSLQAHIFAPSDISPLKRTLIAKRRGQIHLLDEMTGKRNYSEAKAAAEDFSKTEKDLKLLKPNTEDGLDGVATAGLEILHQLREKYGDVLKDKKITLIAPASSGGFAYVAIPFLHEGIQTNLIAVQSEEHSALIRTLKRADSTILTNPVPPPERVIDSIHIQKPEEVGVHLSQEWFSGGLIVRYESALQGALLLHENTGQKLDIASGLPVAALLEHGDFPQISESDIIVLLATGKNIDSELWNSVLNQSIDDKPVEKKQEDRGKKSGLKGKNLGNISSHWKSEWEIPTKEELSFVEQTIRGEKPIAPITNLPPDSPHELKIEQIGFWHYRLLRAQFFLYPNLAGAIVASISLSSHGYWTAVFRHGDKAPEELDLISHIFNHAVSVYKLGADAIQTEFPNEKILFELKGIGGLMGQISIGMAEKIMASLTDPNLITLIHYMWAYTQDDRGIHPETIDQIFDLINKIPKARFKKIRRKMDPIFRELLSRAGVLNREGVPNIPFVDKSIPRAIGKAVGPLYIVRSIIPSIETLMTLPKEAIVFMDYLPTSDLRWGPVQGLITRMQEAETSHAQARARVWRAPHALMPLTPSIEALEGKVVIFEVTEKDVSLLEADPSLIKLAHPATFQSVTLQEASFEHASTLITPDNPLGREPKFVGFKVANQRRLRHKFDSGKNFQSLPAGVRVDIPGGLVLPFGLLKIILEPKGLWTQYNQWITKIKDLAEYSKRSQSYELKGLINDELDFPRDLPQEIRHQVIREVFDSGILTKVGYFVRPSTTAEDLPFPAGFGAGMYQTIPNVKTSHEFWSAFKSALASIWKEEAFWERESFGVDQTKLDIALWLLPSIRADYSFVIHTSDVSTQRSDRMVIEVVEGQGEALVGNSPIYAGFPTRIVVDKSTGQIISKSNSTKKRISSLADAGGTVIEESTPRKEFLRNKDFEKLIDSLTKVGYAIEQEFSVGTREEEPQDIEGVLTFDRRKAEWIVSIVQTRSAGQIHVKKNSGSWPRPTSALSNLNLILAAAVTFGQALNFFQKESGEFFWFRFIIFLTIYSLSLIIHETAHGLELKIRNGFKNDAQLRFISGGWIKGGISITGACGWPGIVISVFLTFFSLGLASYFPSYSEIFMTSAVINIIFSLSPDDWRNLFGAFFNSRVSSEFKQIDSVLRRQPLQLGVGQVHRPKRNHKHHRPLSQLMETESLDNTLVISLLPTDMNSFSRKLASTIEKLLEKGKGTGVIIVDSADLRQEISSLLNQDSSIQVIEAPFLFKNSIVNLAEIDALIKEKVSINKLPSQIQVICPETLRLFQGSLADHSLLARALFVLMNSSLEGISLRLEEISVNIKVNQSVLQQT